MDEVSVESSDCDEFEWKLDQVVNGKVNNAVEMYLKYIKADALVEPQLLKPM